MRNIRLYVIQYVTMAIILVAIAVNCSAGSVSYGYKRVLGIPVNTVIANLNDQNVIITPAISRGGIGTCESFRSIINRTRPTAAAVGTFFCTRSLRPTGDIVINGRLVYDGYLGTALAVTRDNRVCFVRSKQYIWQDYDRLLAAGPTLLRNGCKAVNPRAEGFRSSMHRSRRIRAAIGLSRSNKMIIATTRRPVHLTKLAWIMKRLGASDAVVVDGGSSTALYCRGKFLARPSRGMTNCLLVYDSLYAYERYRYTLYPEASYAQAEY